MAPGGDFVGVDVGAKALHAVRLDSDFAFGDGIVTEADDLTPFLEWLGDPSVVAIDAPDRASTRPHRNDPKLKPKFQEARCAEVALTKEGYWVPWVTPDQPVEGSWIAVGIELFKAISEKSTADRIEVYPHAGFRELAGGIQLPKKQSVAGIRRRSNLLREAGVRVRDLELWSHDSLDAALAAVIAVHRGREWAVKVECDRESKCSHDGSAMWLPRRPTNA